MAVFLSPGVYVREIDLSLYVPNLSTTALGLVGLATKGPINVPTYITNPVQFATTFGDPDTDFMGPYAALQYLHSGRQLWYVRVSEYSGQDTYAAVAASTGSNITESATQASVTGTTNTLITFGASSNTLNFCIDGIFDPFEYIFVIQAPATTLVKSNKEVADLLNGDSGFSTYLTASLSTNGTLTIKHKLYGSNHSIQITGNAAALFAFPTTGTTTPAFGLGTITEAPYVQGSGVAWPVTVSAGTTNNKLKFTKLNGTTRTSVDITVGDSSYTLAALITALNNDATFNDYFVASNYAEQLRVSFLANPSGGPYTYLSLDEPTNQDGTPTMFGFTAKALTTLGYPDLAAGITITPGVNDTLVFRLHDDDASPTADSTLTMVIPTNTIAAVAADGLLTSTGVAPSDGDTVDINGRTYTFKDPLTGGNGTGNTPDEVYINGTAAAALVNLKKAFDASGVAGTDYGVGTLANALIHGDAIDATTLAVIADTAGAAGNLISTTTPVGATLSWGDTTLNNGADENLNEPYPDCQSIVDELNALATGPNADLVFSLVTAGATEHISFGYEGATFKDLTLVTSHDNATTYSTATGLFSPLPFIKKYASTTTPVLEVNAVSEGTWGNNLSVEFANVTSTSFTLNVYEKSFLVESYKSLVKTPLTITDPDDATLTIDNPAYVENAINGVSPRITVINTDDNLLMPIQTVSQRFKLEGGLNGETPPGNDNPSIYIGTVSGGVKTGLQFFSNPEEIDLNVVAVPGISSAAVVNAMIELCQNRGDCMAIVDPPYRDTANRPLTPQTVVDWRNGTGQWADDHATFNSSYAAAYWPWLQIYDPVNKQKVWTPPSGHIANVYAYSDFTTEPWRAPAGLTRGRLVSPLLAEYNPTLGERDLLYSNNINPIATFIRDGINVFGQKTLQTKPSALDRVNVRRLMLYLEKVIATAARQLVFEPADDITWLSFVNLVDPYLQAVKDRRGLIEYQVRCDSTTNTPDVVDRNEMNAIILIKPTKAAEFIKIDFVLTAQSTSFNELVF